MWLNEKLRLLLFIPWIQNDKIKEKLEMREKCTNKDWENPEFSIFIWREVWWTLCGTWTFSSPIEFESNSTIIKDRDFGTSILFFFSFWEFYLLCHENDWEIFNFLVSKQSSFNFVKFEILGPFSISDEKKSFWQANSSWTRSVYFIDKFHQKSDSKRIRKVWTPKN